MSKAVYKYMVFPSNSLTVDVNVSPHAEFLAIDSQNGSVVVWALVDPSDETEKRTITLIETGKHVPDDVLNHSSYLGTVVLLNGAYVVHAWVSDPPRMSTPIGSHR